MITMLAQAATTEAAPGMTFAQYTTLAYVVGTLLLWGYAGLLFKERRRLRRASVVK